MPLPELESHISFIQFVALRNMLFKRVQSTIIFKDFLGLATLNSFQEISSLEVLALIKAFNDAAIQEIKTRPTFGEKRFEGAILRIWELARDASKSNSISEAKNWRMVMATCNATYEAICNTRIIILRRAAA